MNRAIALRTRGGDYAIPVKCQRIRPSDYPLPPPPPPSPPPFPGDHKVGVVLRCISNQPKYKYSIHFNLCFVDLYTDAAVDASLEELTRISPNLQIDVGTCLSIVEFGFCVWDESLFVFEGADSNYVVEGNQKSIYTYDLRYLKKPSAWKKMVYLHTIRECSGGDFKKKSQSITKIGDMNSPKHQPAAVPTPDGKKIILLDIELRSTSVFELFDPVTSSSESLPMIEDLLSEKGTMSITSHGFATESRFVVHIPSHGKWFIDLALPENGWINLVGVNVDSISYDRKLLFSVIWDQFILNPDYVIDFHHSCYYPVPSTFVETMDLEYDRIGATVCRDAYLTLLEHDKKKGEFDFCVLHSEGRWSSTTPHCNVTIDVCRALYDNKEKPPRVDLQLKSSRALKLSCRPDGEMALVTLSAVFSII